jgi:hypothetical protein
MTDNRKAGSRNTRRVALGTAWCALLLAQFGNSALAGPAEQAKRIYERIAGVPPPPAVLLSMVNAINASPGQTGLMNAAVIATQAPTFYNVTLKNLVIPWTNRDQTVFAPSTTTPRP